jgi:hypothetical protein
VELPLPAPRPRTPARKRPELAARYRRFSQRCLRQGQAIYRGFVEAGILAMDAAQIESLTINAWIVLTSWVRFLSTTREHSAHLGEEAFKRGVYQVLVLELGFVTDRPAAVDACAGIPCTVQPGPGALNQGLRAIDQETVMPLAQLITPQQLAERWTRPAGDPRLSLCPRRCGLRPTQLCPGAYRRGAFC